VPPPWGPGGPGPGGPLIWNCDGGGNCILLCTISSAQLHRIIVEWTYSEEYVGESYLGYKTVVGVLLGLGPDDGYLGYGSCDVVGDCSFLVQDRACRGV
jgi:hypothetical protein